MRTAIILAALLAGAASLARAESATFRVALAGSDLGTVSVEASGSGETARAAFRSTFADTPFSLADGSLDGTSQPATDAGRTVRQYYSTSDFTSGGRVVSIVMEGGRVTSVAIDPSADLTGMSAPERVPAGVLDPAQALARLAFSPTCPEPFRLYEGRRVVILSLSPTDAAGTACEGSYRVTEGPGHMEPLNITSVRLAARYDPAGGGLMELTLRTGPFEMRLAR